VSDFLRAWCPASLEYAVSRNRPLLLDENARAEQRLAELADARDFLMRDVLELRQQLDVEELAENGLDNVRLLIETPRMH
jgi:hypothetical protein